MTTLPNIANQLTAYEAAAIFYSYSPANPSAPDRRLTWATLVGAVPGVPLARYSTLLQLVGAKLTHLYRAAGNMTIPSINSGAEGDATFTVTGAIAGDLVLLNPTAAPAAGLAISAAWVSAADTVTARIRNHGGGNYGGGTLAVVALVQRSAAADV